MPLVINSLGGGHIHTHRHTDTQAHTLTHIHTHKHTHTEDPHKINFKKPGVHQTAAGAPGLTKIMFKCTRAI